MGYTRKLTPSDRPAIRAHFARMSQDDVRLRFGHAVTPGAVTNHIEQLDFRDNILLGHVDGGLVRGFIEILPLGDTPPRKAELALTVEQDWQGHGIGTELCRRGLIMACNRRIERVFMVCLTENVRMQRVAEKLEGKVLSRHGDVESEVMLPQPSPWSFAQENAIIGGGFLGALTDGLSGFGEPLPAT